MMAAEDEIKAADLHSYLSLNVDTGEIFWKHRDVAMFKPRGQPTYQAANVWNAKYSGKAAFTARDSHGYFMGAIQDRTLKKHRVVWAMVHGEWPNGCIDHINGDKSDNRPCNLRVVDHQTNMRNRRRNTKSKSDVPGVFFHAPSNGYYVRICNQYVGYFKEKDEAIAARMKAVDRIGGFTKRHNEALSTEEE